MPSGTTAVSTIHRSTSPSPGPQLALRPQPSVSISSDFLWTFNEEPHRTRRQAIIKAHPEVIRQCHQFASQFLVLMTFLQVTKLCGHEPLTKYLVLVVVLLQLSCAAWLSNCPILSVRWLVVSYVIGATANQNLFLAIHEISHNLAFKSPTANRLFAVVANLPIGLPYSAAFRVSKSFKICFLIPPLN